MTGKMDNVWAGIFVDTGALVVYDPELQISGQEKINVYSVSRDLVRRFVAAEVREKLRKVSGVERTQALTKYYAWKVINGTQFLEKERERIEASAPKTRQEIVELHRKFMTAHGYEYLGSVDSRKSYHRVTHCWNCKNHLNNGVNIECVSCDWIICDCGACGCSYSS